MRRHLRRDGLDAYLERAVDERLVQVKDEAFTALVLGGLGRQEEFLGLVRGDGGRALD